VEFLCSPCFVNVLIRRTYVVTSVVNLAQSRRETPLPLQRRRRMNYILAVELGIRTNWAQHSYCSRYLAPHSCCSRYLAPHSCCSRYLAPHSCCSRHLRCWLIGTHQSVPFAVPVVWTEQQDHLTDCQLCFTKMGGNNSKATRNVVYPSIPSTLRPVEHDDSLPIPKPPQQSTVHEEERTSTSQ
jgi:hypothetical protein